MVEEGYEEPGDYEGPQAWHEKDAQTVENGRVICYESTNDDSDTGYPSGYSSWQSRYPDVGSFLRSAGVSRTGVSGVRVTVTLDGEEVTAENKARLLKEYSAETALPGA